MIKATVPLSSVFLMCRNGHVRTHRRDSWAMLTVERAWMTDDDVNPMSDNFYKPNHPPAPPRQPQPGERLFEFVVKRNNARWLCELRDEGSHYGVEAQFFQNEELRFSRRFKTRALAVQWAEEERKAIEQGG